MTAIQPIHGLSDPNKNQRVQTHNYNLPVNHSSVSHSANTNYAASADTIVYNNADLQGNNALIQNAASRKQIEQLIGNSKDILQILFLVLLSSTENVTTATANTANVITSLKGVSNTLSQAATGLEAYYNFLTKATNTNSSGSISTGSITDWELCGAALTDSSMPGAGAGTPCDSSGTTYSLSPLKTALEQICGVTITDTDSNVTIMSYMTRMQNIINSNLIKINGSNSKTTTDDFKYFNTIKTSGPVYSTGATTLASTVASLQSDLVTATNSATTQNTTTNAQFNSLEAIFQQIFSSASDALTMFKDVTQGSIGKID